MEHRNKSINRNPSYDTRILEKYEHINHTRSQNKVVRNCTRRLSTTRKLCVHITNCTYVTRRLSLIEDLDEQLCVVDSLDKALNESEHLPSINDKAFDDENWWTDTPCPRDEPSVSNMTQQCMDDSFCVTYGEHDFTDCQEIPSKELTECSEDDHDIDYSIDSEGQYSLEFPERLCFINEDGDKNEEEGEEWKNYEDDTGVEEELCFQVSQLSGHRKETISPFEDSKKLSYFQKYDFKEADDKNFQFEKRDDAVCFDSTKDDEEDSDNSMDSEGQYSLDRPVRLSLVEEEEEDDEEECYENTDQFARFGKYVIRSKELLTSFNDKNRCDYPKYNRLLNVKDANLEFIEVEDLVWNESLKCSTPILVNISPVTSAHTQNIESIGAHLLSVVLKRTTDLFGILFGALKRKSNSPWTKTDLTMPPEHLDVILDKKDTDNIMQRLVKVICTIVSCLKKRFVSRQYNVTKQVPTASRSNGRNEVSGLRCARQFLSEIHGF